MVIWEKNIYIFITKSKIADLTTSHKSAKYHKIWNKDTYFIHYFIHTRIPAPNTLSPPPIHLRHAAYLWTSIIPKLLKFKFSPFLSYAKATKRNIFQNPRFTGFKLGIFRKRLLHKRNSNKVTPTHTHAHTCFTHTCMHTHTHASIVIIYMYVLFI